MPSPLSTDQLLALAHTYWRSDTTYDLRQERSPETERREERWEQALREIGRWHALLRDLRAELPRFTIGDGTATPDACFRCVVYPVKGDPLPPFGWAVVGCVSILAPLYIVYGVRYEDTSQTRGRPKLCFEPLPPEMKPSADILSKKFEETLGLTKLPRELAETPVPLFVEWVEPPRTTLFHALFTNAPDNLP